MAKTTKFTVQGGRLSDFPVDMLRYDCCWPERSEDAAMIATLARQHDAEIARLPAKVTVRLCTEAKIGPTPARWASFMWRVLDEDTGARQVAR